MTLLDDFKRTVNDAEARDANGVTKPNSQYAKWAHDNPGDLARWHTFRDAILAGQRPTPPAMTTDHGRELVDFGIEHLDATAPVTPPPPPPPSGWKLGTNAYPGQSVKAQEFSVHIRVDRGQPSDWTGATLCGIVGLDQNSWMASCPVVELDNEPYFAGVDAAVWAVRARDCAKAVRAKNPSAKILLPARVVDNGDYYGLHRDAVSGGKAKALEDWHEAVFDARMAGHEYDAAVAIADERVPVAKTTPSELARAGATWSPWLGRVNAAAPDIWQYVNGVAVHPYTAGQPPVGYSTMKALDNLRSQLKSFGADIPFWATEFGYTTGPSQDNAPSVSEAQQASLLGQQLDAFKARGDVAGAYIFVLYDQPGVWAYGLLRSDGSRKPAWDPAHSKL